MNRPAYIDKLISYKDKDIIKVITGLRRSGKSTLLELFKDNLIRTGISLEQTQLYNYELPENFLNKTWETIYFEIKSKLIAGENNYIFLDEIQNIQNFEKLVDGLYVTENVDVYITGSNAYLLSNELATLLSGRYIEISILPFSFKEYLQFREIDYNNKYLNYEALFFDFVNETSLPKGIELREEGYDKIISHKGIDDKIIEMRDKFVLIDRDVADLYGVETKRVNEAVSNNKDKFPEDYMFEITKDEKSVVVEYFDHIAPIKYSPHLPKVFTKKGLWMLATILSSKKV